MASECEEVTIGSVEVTCNRWIRDFLYFSIDNPSMGLSPHEARELAAYILRWAETGKLFEPAPATVAGVHYQPEPDHDRPPNCERP